MERVEKEPTEDYVSEEGLKPESVIALNLGSVMNDSDTSDTEVVESDRYSEGMELVESGTISNDELCFSSNESEREVSDFLTSEDSDGDWISCC